MRYATKTPWWLKKLYPSCIWEMPSDEKKIYLSFDDGPHPQITPFVLDELKKFDAKATFFCLGKNVANYGDTFRRILNEGHAIGNHTFHHKNGWKTNDREYFQDIAAAKKYIDSALFRPPYGKITPWQVRNVKKNLQMHIVMWSVLSADFDAKINPETCLQNTLLAAKPGSIIVFHDSEKAWTNLAYALPRVLTHFSEEGYRFDKINL
ncbi:MAG: polysaccharide deacetylase family protein [Chitinophagaceae bacterium]|nr:polysaccharide deacetylase family protein [Chitinophagaceae bacterium]